MIAKVAPKRLSGRGSFVDLRHYLERDERGERRPDLVATWAGSVVGVGTADVEMEHVAALGRTEAPVYHAILSWRPGEEIDAAVARAAVDSTLTSLGAEGHQWFAALHRHAEDERYHVHLMLNRVHPMTLRTLHPRHDYAKLARAAEHVEREYGCLVDRKMPWRRWLPEIDLSLSSLEAEHLMQDAIERIRLEPEGARMAEQDAVRRAGYSWAALLQRAAVPAALEAAARPQARWEDVHAALRAYGVRLERAGSGFRVVGPETRQHVKASRVGLHGKALTATLGAYVAPQQPAVDLRQRLEAARAAMQEARCWAELHDSLGALGFAVERRGKGGRLRDMDDDGRGVQLGKAGASMPSLERRLGGYTVPEALEQAAQREHARKMQGVAERLAQLEEHPELVLQRLSAHHSVWAPEDVEREIARTLGGSPELLAANEGGIQRVADAVLSRCVALDVERGLHSTADIVQQEREAIAAADELRQRRRNLRLRAPSTELDGQQAAAFAHLAGEDGDLRIVTGIAGAGKSRLLRDVCGAYAEAGHRVVGTAVAGAAARVLGEEAQIATRTVARFLWDVKQGRERLDARTVLVVDEASTLGGADIHAIATAAAEAGARVLLLGDVQQHEAVARGPLFGELAERCGAQDLGQTRRAHQLWMREVGQDLRLGRTSKALDTLREHGAVREHQSSDDAKVALAQHYADAVRADKSALLIATRTEDVAELNELARAELRHALGDERPYSTAFGARRFAVGEQIVTREPDRLTKTVNGDTWRLLGHREDGRLEIARDRDGRRVVWDLRAKPAVDYGYATTSFRAQGRTVDAAYVYASGADSRRGLYVDATRARETVEIAYGRDEIEDFGELLNLGARERAKLNTIACARDVYERRLEQERARMEIPEERAAGRAPAVEVYAYDAKGEARRASEGEVFSGEVEGFEISTKTGRGRLRFGDRAGSRYAVVFGSQLASRLERGFGLAEQVVIMKSQDGGVDVRAERVRLSVDALGHVQELHVDPPRMRGPQGPSGPTLGGF